MPTRMGLAKDDLVLEVGRDSDCDSTLRDQLMAITGTKFLEGSTSEVVDAVIIWWRWLECDQGCLGSRLGSTIGAGS